MKSPCPPGAEGKSVPRHAPYVWVGGSPGCGWLEVSRGARGSWETADSMRGDRCGAKSAALSTHREHTQIDGPSLDGRRRLANDTGRRAAWMGTSTWSARVNVCPALRIDMGSQTGT